MTAQTKRKRRKTIVGETRYAGQGNDGADYGVTTLTTTRDAMVIRPEPCPTCPWRRDAEVGRFPPQAYRESAHTAHDAAQTTFACHESGKKNPATCAGFILANSAHNLGLRMALAFGRVSGEKLEEIFQRQQESGPALYDSYREMAVANGVPEDDPAIADCRADHD